MRDFIAAHAGCHLHCAAMVGNLAPTLFPYTTLFRSQQVRPYGGQPVVAGHPVIGVEAGLKLLAGLDADEDRESTRLNSSHRCISYAVSCLKKQHRGLPSRHAASP